MSELKDYSILDIEAIDDERFTKESAHGKWVPESRVYLKSEADAVIAEMEENHKKEVGQLLIEIVELKCEINRKDGVCKRWFERCMEARTENVKLKRALWIARAERAEECHFMWCQLIYDKKYGIVKFNVRKEWGENVKQGQTLHTPQGWADVWDDVERKCRIKAEEYR